MSIFKVPREEIDACIDVLHRVKGMTLSEKDRKNVIDRVTPTLRKLRGGREMIEQLPWELDMGHAKMHIDFLSSHDRSRSFDFGGLLKRTGWVGGIAFTIVLLVASFGFGGFLARCDGAYDIAMKQINSCDAATDRLGKPVAQQWIGSASGSSDTRGGGWGVAQWSIPVSGSKGSGTYRYAAESHAGAWQIVKASLEVDGEKLGVYPCGTSWEGIALDASRDSKPLLQAFGRAGTARNVSGRTSIVNGQGCELSVTPNVDFGKSSPFNCRVVVRCGPTVLYGWEGAGYTTCQTDEGLPTTAKDQWGTAEDTDPIVELDIPGSRVVVRDNNPKSTWSVEIAWDDSTAPAAPAILPQDS